MFRTLIAALALVFAVALPAAAREKRVALIVGIGDYQHLSSLDRWRASPCCSRYSLSA